MSDYRYYELNAEKDGSGSKRVVLTDLSNIVVAGSLLPDRESRIFPLNYDVARAEGLYVSGDEVFEAPNDAFDTRAYESERQFVVIGRIAQGEDLNLILP